MRPFKAIPLPAGKQEVEGVVMFDYIKVDERTGGDACKQGH